MIVPHKKSLDEWIVKNTADDLFDLHALQTIQRFANSLAYDPQRPVRSILLFGWKLSARKQELDKQLK
jgi:hypothetical protein